MAVPLTVIVPTFNEERNVTRALESVAGWAARVCVVDSFSTDRTLELCESFGDVCIVRHEFEDYGKQWNWALDNLPIETEWVMKLDADEAVTPKLRAEIEAALRTAAPDVAAFAVWRKVIFMGKWLRHTVGKCYDVRIWRHRRARFEERSVNEHLVVDGAIRRLKAPLLHEDRKGISAWVWRHNRYSTLEAREYFRSANGKGPRPSGKGITFRRFVKQCVWPWVPFKPLAHFLHLYVLRLGFLDGREGLAYAQLRYFYYYLIGLKKREHRRADRTPAQETARRRRPDPLSRNTAASQEPVTWSNLSKS